MGTTPPPAPPPTETTEAEEVDALIQALAAEPITAPTWESVASDLNAEDPNLAVTPREVYDVVQLTCSEGTTEPLRQFIDERLDSLELNSLSSVLGIVNLMQAQCPPPQGVSEFNLTAISALSFNGAAHTIQSEAAADQRLHQVCQILDNFGSAPIAALTNRLLQWASHQRFSDEDAVEFVVGAATKTCDAWIGPATDAIQRITNG